MPPSPELVWKTRLSQAAAVYRAGPQLPPEPVLHHVDALRRIDADGRLREAMVMLQSPGDRAKGMTADLFAPAGDGAEDRSILRSVARGGEKNIP
ncbi:hypothetical protein [Streptomyces katrae]|uniref:hypothetical protein n=1 Tax=Streptomyces katrae TaxID=68223 RepID=UPI0004BFF0CC|nr:hypothetical protein [Streptomyces katrae]